jgi:hypothetical protein
MAPPVEIIELPRDEPSPRPAPVRRSRAKLYLATPCFGCQMSAAYLASVLNLQAECAMRGIECQTDFIGNESLVERARNILVARFLKTDATHLLFVDADIGFRPESVFRLLDSGKDVVTAVYPKKSFNWSMVKTKLEQKDPEPVRQMGLDFNINIASDREPVENGMVRVLDSATGFMMIKRQVLERMTAHFQQELYCINDIPGHNPKDYVAIFACMVDTSTRRFLSEDYSFCRRYQQLGGEIWADIASPLVHIGHNFFHGDVRQRLSPTNPKTSA